MFSFAIRYMKSKIIQWADKQFQFPKRKILWIITVPAIWSHGAKQVMRQAIDKVIYIKYCAFKCAIRYIYACMYICDWICEKGSCSIFTNFLH